MKYIVSIPNGGFALSRTCESIGEAYETVKALNLMGVSLDNVMRQLVELKGGNYARLPQETLVRAQEEDE